jgi:DNA-binding response OmpR family regulator
MLQRPILALGDVVFQPPYRRMRIGGRDVRLTERETSVLEALALRGAASREDLCDAMYRGTDFQPKSAHHVDPHICRLRARLRGSRVCIHAMHKRGFRLVVT